MSSITRERLLGVSHDGVHAIGLRAVASAIMRLRKIVEPNPRSPCFIRAVRSCGYMFVPDGDMRAA